MSTDHARLPVPLASILIDGDIKATTQRGEERTAELYTKYEDLNLEDLSNF